MVGAHGQQTVTVALPAKAPVVGTPVSVTSYDEMLDVLQHVRPPDRALTVAVCTVHSVMSARRDDALAVALREADVATPDGMPLVWALRATGVPGQTRVYGPDLMAHAFAASGDRSWTHYLYGASAETLRRLEANLAQRYPQAKVAGSHAPPFRPLSEAELQTDLDAIAASGADIVWVGLGMPKQERWMHEVRDRLPGTALVGVGAAFDFHAGTVAQAPAWMQRAGLEWLFRLIQEPRRLWRRYVWNNPAYLVLLSAQVVRHRLSRPR